MNADASVEIAIRLISVGVIIDAAESLWIRQEFDRCGFYNWQVLRTSHRWMSHGSASPLLDGILSYPNYLAFLLVEIAAASLFLLNLLPRFSTPLLFAMLACRLLSQLRNQFGMDGADQMRIVVLAGCFGYRIVPEAWAKGACIWFVCLQCILAYVTAGVAKAASPTWREGAAVRDILRTNSLGNRICFQWLSRYKGLSWAACWATIVFECGTPILILGGPKFCMAFLACGVIFHISIAITMGLNDFVWAFLAAYPLVLQCSINFATLIKHVSPN